METVYKLKISLMSHGVRISKAALEYLQGNDSTPLSAFDYVTTSGVVLILPGNVYVNASFKEDFYQNSDNCLDYNGCLFVDSLYGRIEVSCLPAPFYCSKTLPSGRQVTTVINSHADRMRISPISGCNNRCQFCDLGTTNTYRKTEINDIDAALDIAMQDKILPPKHLLISGGTPKKEDEPYMDTVYKRAIERCHLPVDVMMAPRDNFNILEQLKEWGCNGLSINLEINDEETAQRVMPEKYHTGRKYYLQFISEAVRIFGPGAVRSCIILGLEPSNSTLEGVRQLADIGCDPVLSPFKPLKGTLLESINPPGPKLMETVYGEAERIVRDNNVLLGPRCIPCQHNTLTFPLESGDYFFY